MLRYVILLGALVLACHEKPVPPPAAPAPIAAPTPIAVMLDAGAITAPPDAGLAPPGVSVSLVTQGDDGCRWERLDLTSGQRQRVATFPGQCADFPDPSMAWSADGKRALWSDGESLWRLVPGTGQKTKLPALPEKAGSIDLFGFDREGRAMALTVSSSDEDKKLEWEGKVFTPPEMGADGWPALAHAFRLDPNDRWQHVEVKVTTSEGDYTQESRVLDARQGFYTGINRDWGPNGKVIHDAKLVERLNALCNKTVDAEAPDDEEGWVEITDGVYNREEVMEARHGGTLNLAFERDGKLTPAPQLPGGEYGTVETKGGYVLLATDKSVRVYLPQQSKVVFSSDAVKDARFWP